MNKQITVSAAPGVKVPKEDAPRRYITGTETVDDTAYYRRRIADGDLILAPAPAQGKTKGADNGK